jgi:hypothetical protein
MLNRILAGISRPKVDRIYNSLNMLRLLLIAGLCCHASAQQWNCTNVLDWDFFASKVTSNNLGGLGPNFEDKQEIRYSSILKNNDKVDMVITVGEGYITVPNKKGESGSTNNGLLGKFGQVNVRGDSSAEFTIRLVDAGTDKLYDIRKDQKVQFSVYDFDRAGNRVSEHEFAQFKTPVASYSVVEGATVEVEGDGSDGTLYVQSGRAGSAADNPTDPLKMTPIQQQSKISVTYVGTAEWKIVLGDKGGYELAGRNFLFAGRSQGDCACVGIADWALHNNLKYNNLGGLGPVTSDPAELRYEKVFTTGYEMQPIDLVIKVAEGSEYIVANTDLNGLWPIVSDTSQMGQVNIKTGTQSTFDFMFVKTGTDELYELSNVMFSVYDLDEKAIGLGKNHEYVEFNTPVTNWTLTQPSLVKKSGSISGAKGLLKFRSTEPGVLSDNPTNPLKLTPLQKQRSVTVWYSGASKFQITLGHSAEHPSAGGRNMLFAGPGIYCPAVDHSAKGTPATVLASTNTVLSSTDTNTQDSESHLSTALLIALFVGVGVVAVVGAVVVYRRKRIRDGVELEHLQNAGHLSYEAVMMPKAAP